MKKEQIVVSFFYKLSVILMLSSLLPYMALGQGAGNKNRCKQLAIEAAQLAKESYMYAKMGYFANKLSLLKGNTDSAIYYIKGSISAIDSAILLASDYDLMAKNLASLSKKEAEQAYRLLNSSKNKTEVRSKQQLLEEATLLAGNATADAYHASFYFKDSKPEVKNTKVSKDTIQKKITKLDIDQTLFALLDEQLIEKEEKNKGEIAKLTEKLKVTKNPGKTAKIKAEIKELEENEAEVEKKDKEAKEKLGKINTEIEERDKHITSDTKSEETIFSKSLSRPADEWNKQVLLEPEMPMGLIYQVQIGVYKNAVPSETFKGITPIFGKNIVGGITYSTGIFEKLADAGQAKDYVKSIGLTDAFVVAYYDRKKITMAEAAALEKK